MQLLSLLILNSLVVVGIWFTCNYEAQKGLRPVVGKQLLWFIKYYGTKWFGDSFMKPVCGCVVCMASVHGTWFFWTFIHTSVIEWLTWMLALAGLITFYVHTGAIKTWLVESK